MVHGGGGGVDNHHALSRQVPCCSELGGGCLPVGAVIAVGTVRRMKPGHCPHLRDKPSGSVWGVSSWAEPHKRRHE